MNIDPRMDEFFTNEFLSSREETLVRESIQNSLDASENAGEVKVRFTQSRAGFLD